MNKTLRSILEGIIPGGEGLPSAHEIELYNKFINIVSSLKPQPRRLVNISIFLLNISSFLRFAKTFGMLSLKDRIKYLEKLETDGLLGDLINLIKVIAYAIYFSTNTVAEKIGYDRKPLIRGIPKTYIKYSTINYPKDVRTREYDVCIVGSGAGGSVAAYELAKRGLKVAVFEEGPAAFAPDFKLPPIERAIKYYRDNGLTFTFGKPIIHVPIGRVLGGTTTVNSGTMYELPEWVLINWRKEFGFKLTYKTLKDGFKFLKEIMHIKPVPEHILGNNGIMLREAALRLGVNGHPTNRPIIECVGQGECAFGCPHDAKLSTGISLLKKAVEYSADIYTGFKVEKLIIRGNRCRGLIVSAGNGDKMIFSCNYVVVAAGALSTPILLWKSGVKNKNLGKNLHIHPALGVIGLFDKNIYGWKGTMQSYVVDELLKDGILILSTFPPPGIGFSAGAVPGVGKKFMWYAARYHMLASFGVQISDINTGNIMLKLKLIRYDLGEEDKDRILHGIKLASELMFSIESKEVYIPIKGRGIINHIGEIEHLFNYPPKRFKLSAYHPMSTARMGGEPEISVVSMDGSLYNIDNIFICDASILPSSTFVNPQLTIMSISRYIIQNLCKYMGV